MMKRIEKLQDHPVFKEQCRLLWEAERERFFCRHTMEHFLDVARLTYIYNLEDDAKIDKELIYAAALLHDIGRYEQISQGTPHHMASARIAEIILKDCGFDEKEICTVREAIEHHRTEAGQNEKENLLSVYLYRADKQSRNCFSCPAIAECNWPAEKKNMVIRY